MPVVLRALNEVWGMNPRDSGPAGVDQDQETAAHRSLGHEPQRQRVWVEGSSACTPAQRSLGHEPQRQLRTSSATGSGRSGHAQRSLGHEPQRQTEAIEDNTEAIEALNEVWGMNPRDSPDLKSKRGSAATLNEVWGMNPRDRSGVASGRHALVERSTKSGA